MFGMLRGAMPVLMVALSARRCIWARVVASALFASWDCWQATASAKSMLEDRERVRAMCAGPVKVATEAALQRTALTVAATVRLDGASPCRAIQF